LLLASGRKTGDGHCLDDGERIAVEQLPILEGSGLGFVGVADQIVRPRGLLGDGIPLSSRGERGAAATHET